jgi:hypothetical protein
MHVDMGSMTTKRSPAHVLVTLRCKIKAEGCTDKHNLIYPPWTVSDVSATPSDR